MRLLILNWRDLRHPLAGGSEVYAQNLARHWAAQGHDVTFFCSASPGLPAHEETDGYHIIRRGNRFLVYREARRYVEQEARSFDGILDVVNTRPFLTPRWSTETPRVALIHQVCRDVWRYEVPAPVAVVGRHILEPRWLQVYKHTPVLTLSPSSQDSLHGYGLTDITIVPVGVDPPVVRPRPVKAGAPTLIFVGRLSPNKRPADALAAHRLLKERIPDAQLWVVGDGPLAADLRRHSDSQVTFFGRVDAEQKHDLMASAHALIATSVREGWGMTVSEAGLLGTTAIAYDVPGLRDSVPAAGGVLTDPTPQALATEAARMLPDLVTRGPMELGDVGVTSWSSVASDVLVHLANAMRHAR